MTSLRLTPPLTLSDRGRHLLLLFYLLHFPGRHFESVIVFTTKLIEMCFVTQEVVPKSGSYA